eukprot:TRINITY_DN8121_c0_g1_i1.p1 TRINITY_DN8121_c0_g1~~TRINITY_DN8121_c0_g1_i1.p1  ORF type:complete len:123 (+),score=14.19 TRINITY_DN8121_c0_g1_i1:11-379(+)
MSCDPSYDDVVRPIRRYMMPVWSLVALETCFVIGRQDDLVLFDMEGTSVTQKLGVPSFVLCTLKAGHFASAGSFEEGDQNKTIKVWSTEPKPETTRPTLTLCYDLVGHARNINAMLFLPPNR